MRVIGLDVGGANLKIAVLEVVNGKTRLVKTVREYFPLWVRGRQGLEQRLQEIGRELGQGKHCVALCMTAELCDIYETKAEGVIHVVESVRKAFPQADSIRIVGVDVRLHDLDEVYREPLKFAATNWAANAWLAAKLFDYAVLVDTGSTTTSIVPVVEHRPVVWGLTDPEKLTCGELLYIGALRTSVTEIVDKLPYKGRLAEVCHEKFASIGDVNLLLGHVDEHVYITETFDGRGRSLREAAARLARTVCASLELMSLQEVIELARYVYEVAVHKIALALILIRSRLASMGVDLDKVKLVSAGLGEFMIQEAGRRAGFKTILSIDDVVQEAERVAPVLPSYATALMLAEELVAGKTSS